MVMELRQLEYVLAVADHGGITRAADALHVAQPGVSAQIRALERELDVELFARHARGTVPTPVGREVVARAREALAAVDGVRGIAAAHGELTTGRLRIGTVESASHGLFDVISRFRARYPGVRIELREQGSEDLLTGVREGRLDLALMATALARSEEGVTGRRFVEAELVVVGLGVGPWPGPGSETESGSASGPDSWSETESGSDPVSESGSEPRSMSGSAPGTIPVTSLVGRPLITLPPGTGVRAAVDGAFAVVGERPVVACEVSHPAAAIALAGAGMGLAVVPSSEADDAGVPAASPTRAELWPRIAVALDLVWRAGARVAPAPAAFLAMAGRATERGRAEV